MTTPTSTISLLDIQNEFGGANPISLSEYYRGGGYVPASIADVGYGLPSALGAISMSALRGATAIVILNIQINLSSDVNNYVLNTAKVPGYSPGGTRLTFVIDSNVVVGSNSTGSWAFTVDNSWNANDTITIINNGRIVGRGGNGGRGSDLYPTQNPTAGEAGGPALLAQRSVTIQNNNLIGGGGGGAGGGKSFNSCIDVKGTQSCTAVTGAGGGGGQGRDGGTGGANPYLSPQGVVYGSNGTVDQPGIGSNEVYNALYGSPPTPIPTADSLYAKVAGYPTFLGGIGGYLGQPGLEGGDYAFAGQYGQPGGAGGQAVGGNGYITWTNTGTRLGGIA